MSIRLRLTLLYSSILGIALIVFAVFVYAQLQRNLTHELDGSLRATATTSLRFLGSNRGDGDRPGERTGVGRILAFRGGTLPSPASAQPDTYLQVVDSSGNVLSRSGNLVIADLALPPPAANFRSGSFEDVKLNDQDLRMLVQPLRFDPSVVGISGSGFLEVARPLTDVEGALSHLRVIMFLGAVGALLIAGAAGWVLSTTALRPIARLTAAAREIGEEQDFSRRVLYQGPRDEVGRLASTFNEMLERLQASYARIQSALDAQRRFVADASHELRTPLTTIRGNVELLALDEENESGERREALEDIASEAERMSRLVTDLLALARADSGLHLKHSPVRVRPLVEEVSRQVRRTAGTVHFEIGSIPDVEVSGSADHLKQLLLILLDNARKYSPEGSVVRLTAEQSSGWLQVSVSDTGPGIPREEQERIFDRFYRLDPSRHGEGAGLGLAIARWIVSEHDGRLSVDSRPGEGSTFIVALPIAIEPITSSSSRETVAV
jgi:two-component system OmpR family sensor kinase